MAKLQKLHSVICCNPENEFVMLFRALFILNVYNVFVAVRSQNDDRVYYKSLFNDKFSKNKSLKDYASDSVRAQLTESFFDNVNLIDGSNLINPTYKNEPKVQQLNQIKTTLISRQVSHPYNIEMEKKIPLYIKVPKEKSYPLFVPAMEKPVHYPFKMWAPQTYPTEKPVSIPIKVPIEKQASLFVPKPNPVYKENIVGFTDEKPVPFRIKVHYERPYAAHIPEKSVLFSIEKQIPQHLPVSHERFVPLQVEKPYSMQYEKPVSYSVEKIVPYPVPIPIQVPMEIPVPIHVMKHEPIFIPVHEQQAEESTDANGLTNLNGYHGYMIPHFIMPTAFSKNIVYENEAAIPSAPITEASTGEAVEDLKFGSSVQFPEIQPQPGQRLDQTENIVSTSTVQSSTDNSLTSVLTPANPLITPS